MATKTYNPRTPGQRQRRSADFSELTEKSPQKSLLKKKKSNAGRNNQGKLTVRHRGSGHKKRYRVIDFARDKKGVPGTIKSIEYDPNRTAFISLVFYKDGEKRYILTPKETKVDMQIISDENAEIQNGNHLPLYNIPTGTIIHNVEMTPGKGGQMGRSAGSNITLMAKSDKYATLKVPSGEVRLVSILCWATIGTVSNMEHHNVVLGKAGISRKKGWRPTVRGAVMNACDHPHGGGEGRAPVGRPGPMTPWGKPALGKRTRKNERTNKFIVRRRRK